MVDSLRNLKCIDIIIIIINIVAAIITYHIMTIVAIAHGIHGMIDIMILITTIIFIGMIENILCHIEIDLLKDI